MEGERWRSLTDRWSWAAGPSGLAAAIELQEARDLAGDGDRARARGRRDPSPLRPHRLRRCAISARSLSGPRYAERYRELAEEAGVEILTETMVTDWEGTAGPEADRAGRAGGDRASRRGPGDGLPRAPALGAARPGSRPAGVMTTSTLQQLVHLRGQKVGRRAVIVGAEHVSFSAVATLAHGGASVAGLVTELPRHQSLAAFRAGAALRYRAPVWARTAVSAIHGTERVESVELTELDSGRTRTVECDLVDLHRRLDPRPRAGGDGRLRARSRDASARSSTRRCARPAPGCSRRETCCTRPRPRTSARSTAATSPRRSPRICAVPASGRPTFGSPRAAPLAWVAPNLLLATGHPPPRDRFLLRSREFVRRAADPGPPGRTRALERPGRAAGSGALRAHPGGLGGRGRPRPRPA